ncbi:MAG: chemotaxis protein CheW [Thermodesulfobacteriota bacterium]
MSSDDADSNDEILAIFIEEATEHLEVIEPALLSIEVSGSNSDPEIINTIFRAVHSVKGSAGFFGLQKITELAHRMENLMAKVRDGSIAPTPDVVGPLLSGLDKLQIMIGDVSSSEDVEIAGEVAGIEAVMSGVDSSLTDSPSPEAEQKSNGADEWHEGSSGEPLEELSGIAWDVNEYQSIKDEAIANGHNLFSITFTLPTGSDKKSTALAETKTFLGSIGSIVAAMPDVREDVVSAELCSEDEEVRYTLLLSTVIEKGILVEALNVPDENIMAIDLKGDSQTVTANETVSGDGAMMEEKKTIKQESGEASTATIGRAVTKKRADKGASSTESVRVRVELLDKIMALAGELVLGRNQLLRQYSDRKNNAILIAHSQRVTELQESVMKTRLQPVGAVFSKFKRIIRDIAKTVNKEINLVLDGEDVELDRSIIEVLSDPLTHMIRNSADHAIESPDERERCGKERAGTICLRAFHEGGQVIIEVEDDGAGIDAEKIKEKALQKEIISEEDAKGMSAKELVNLIFHPGFSTVSEVSQLSGRGVGMDVVKKSFEKLGSTIDLSTTVGDGTLFTVRLPLTLAILPSLVVTVNSHTFAIPQVDITEIVRIKEGEAASKVEFIEGEAVYRLRGKLLPVIKLADVLDIKDPTSSSAKAEGCKGNCHSGASHHDDSEGVKSSSQAIQRLIVLRYGTNHLGLLVDTVLDPEEIVVKPMPHLVKICKTFSGATIMGDGRVAMILNIGGIIDKAGFRFDSIEKRALEFEEEERKRAMEERQNLLIFKNPNEEYFGLSLSMISRIEKISADQITSVAGKRFVQFRDKSIQLIAVEEHIKGNRLCNLEGDLYIVIPKAMKDKVGIVAQEIVDVIETVLSLDSDSIESPTVLGSTIINDKMTLVIDVYTLLDAALPHREGTPKRGSHDGNKGGKVLLVEDTPFFRNLEERYLTSAGFDVTTACDGKEGLDILKKNRGGFDIVISDIEMPVMNGYELVKAIKGDKALSHLPVMALTALNSNESRRIGSEAGFDAYEAKVDKERLIAKSGELMDKRKGYEELRGAVGA